MTGRNCIHIFFYTIILFVYIPSLRKSIFISGVGLHVQQPNFVSLIATRAWLSLLIHSKLGRCQEEKTKQKMNNGVKYRGETFKRKKKVISFFFTP